jgi:hypothetical protein
VGALAPVSCELELLVLDYESELDDALRWSDAEVASLQAAVAAPTRVRVTHRESAPCACAL